MEIVKRQRGRKIPFYFTITPKEYIEMKKADCEIDGKESADRRAAWHRQKKSRSRAEFEYLYDTDNEEPETDKSPEYEALEWIKEVCYAYQRNS